MKLKELKSYPTKQRMINWDQGLLHKGHKVLKSEINFCRKEVIDGGWRTDGVSRSSRVA